ncbi:amidohydrolase family protein [Kutzneria sp. NPDC052558]|uniref:amidohydrolase family protein n=1 Tax=Kutzneria sp. NPDC052558 TaxID=3364121 RepID=UPI0037C7D95A
MSVLDLHSHVVPAATPFSARLRKSDARWARLEPGGEVIVSGRLFRRVRQVAWDLAERREQLTKAGVSGQLLSAMPELFALWAPPPDALEYVRAFNVWLAATVANHGGFFVGLGLVPAQEPVVAAAVLSEVAELGLAGVEIPAVPMESPQWIDFFAEAERLRLLVFVHAVGGAEIASFSDPGLANGVLFPNSIGRAIGGLIANGVLARFPRLQVLASHGGGSLVTMLPRMEYFRERSSAAQELLAESVSDYARRVWFDPLVFDAGLLQALAAVVGEDRIVLGTDYPFMERPLAFLDQVPESLAAAVRQENGARLLAGLRQ